VSLILLLTIGAVIFTLLIVGKDIAGVIIAVCGLAVSILRWFYKDPASIGQNHFPRSEAQKGGTFKGRTNPSWRGNLRGGVFRKREEP